MKSMFHMLHYISIIQLVLKSSTLIIYCASCKWSIHMEPSFSTFLMLFPGYKLQANISYSKEGNALNEWNAGEVSYTKEETKSILGKICQGLQPGWQDPGLWRILASSSGRRGWSHPSTKIPIALNEAIAQATSSIQRAAPGRALEVPSDFKSGLRSLGGAGTDALVIPEPLRWEFTTTKKKIQAVHPHSLKSSHYLDLERPTFSHTLVFTQTHSI